MAGGFRRWGGSLDSESKSAAFDQLKESGVRGLFEAREDMRQKLIDEGWTGRFQPDADVTLHDEDAAEPEATAAPGGHGPEPDDGVKMSDLYGETTETEAPDVGIHGPSPEADGREPEL